VSVPEAADEQAGWRERLRQEELNGFAFAFKARTIALCVIALWVVVSSSVGRLPVLMGAAVLFLAVGWLAYASRRSRHALLIQSACAFVDVAIVVFASHLPDGDWYSYHDDSRPKAVRKDIWVDCTLDRIPVFVRAGSVLPHWPLQQYVGEIPHPEPILHAWLKLGEESSRWYEDDGDNESWRDGNFRDSFFTFRGTADSLELERRWDGSWTPGYATAHLVLHGLPAGWHALSVKVDGQAVAFTPDELGRPAVTLSPDFQRIEASWSVPAAPPEETETAMEVSLPV